MHTTYKYIYMCMYIYMCVHVYTYMYINYIICTIAYVYERMCTMHICTPSLSLPPSLSVSLSLDISVPLSRSHSLSLVTLCTGLRCACRPPCFLIMCVCSAMNCMSVCVYMCVCVFACEYLCGGVRVYVCMCVFVCVLLHFVCQPVSLLLSCELICVCL